MRRFVRLSVLVGVLHRLVAARIERQRERIGFPVQFDFETAHVRVCGVLRHRRRKNPCPVRADDLYPNRRGGQDALEAKGGAVWDLYHDRQRDAWHMERLWD